VFFDCWLKSECLLCLGGRLLRGLPFGLYAFQVVAFLNRFLWFDSFDGWLFRLFCCGVFHFFGVCWLVFPLLRLRGSWLGCSNAVVGNSQCCLDGCARGVYLRLGSIVGHGHGVNEKGVIAEPVRPCLAVRCAGVGYCLGCSAKGASVAIVPVADCWRVGLALAARMVLLSCSIAIAIYCGQTSLFIQPFA